LWRPVPGAADTLSNHERSALEKLRMQGASFFGAIHQALGGGYPGETVDTLWSLVWKGMVTNDTFHALRAFVSKRETVRKKSRGGVPPTQFRSRRVTPPSAEGRWATTESRFNTSISDTEWGASQAQQLLARYGVVTREVAAAEYIPGGFSTVYNLLKAFEEAGRIRRGYFVSGLGAAQFATPAALELLRSLREPPDEPETVHVAATDPANPYGTLLDWPFDSRSPRSSFAPDGDSAEIEATRARATDAPARGPVRVVGASVILVDGAAVAYVGRGGRQIFIALPESEPERTRVGRAVSAKLAELAQQGEGREGGLLIADINGTPATHHAIAPLLIEAGFVRSAMGFQVLRRKFTRPEE
jgi:ATP-dependent Lhr-like helicase